MRNAIVDGVRTHYNRNPNLAPVVTSFLLFGLSDVLAQTAEQRHNRLTPASKPGAAPHHQPEEHITSHSWRRTLGVSLCAPFFNGGPLLWFHRGLDTYIGPEATMKRAVPKMLAVQFLYMPISTPAFIFLSKFFCLFLSSETEFAVEMQKFQAESVEKDRIIHGPGSSNCGDEGKDGRRAAVDGTSRGFGEPTGPVLTSSALLAGAAPIACASSISSKGPPREGEKVPLREIDRGKIENEPSRKPSPQEVELEAPACSDTTATTTPPLSLKARQAATIAYRGMRETFWESYIASFFFWPLSDLLNFTVIQRNFGPHFRSSWDAVVDLGWNFYLSTVTFRSDPDYMNWSAAAGTGVPGTTGRSDTIQGKLVVAQS